MRFNRHFLAVAAIFLIGLSVRFIPLLTSPLPFNVDGFPLVRIAEDIIGSGHWAWSSPQSSSELIIYNVKLPVTPLIISGFALITGIPPLKIAQIIIPLISTGALVLIYLIAFKITRNETVSLFAGLALALNGFYVYFGAAAMKEAVGLVLLLLCVFFYLEREDPRKRILASALLLLLILTHHLTVWIAFIMVSLLMLTNNMLDFHHRTFSKKRFTSDLVSGPFLFVFVLLYYNYIKLLHFDSVANPTDYALFASAFLIGVIFSIWFCLPKKRRKESRLFLNWLLVVPLLGFVILIWNHFDPIVDNTIRTSTAQIKYMIPYFLLIGIAIIGLNVVARTRTEYKPLFAALLLSPLLVILFVLVRELDFFTYMVAYRSYDYIDFGLSLCAGTGAGYIINRTTKSIEKRDIGGDTVMRVKLGLSIIFLVICLSTVPLAYNGQEFYGVQDSTYESEFQAMEWVKENYPESSIETDKRLTEIMAPYFELECDSTLPWKLRYGKSSESGTVLFMEDKWTSDGAQMSPLEPFIVGTGIFNRTIQENNLIYSSTPESSNIYIISVR